MNRLALAEFGLMTVDEAAALRGCDPSTVRRWASRGEIPVLVVGEGRSAKFLLRKADVEAFAPNPVGAPEGNQNAVKKKRGRPKGGAKK
jgi:excisionase family DNA binding protein